MKKPSVADITNAFTTILDKLTSIKNPNDVVSLKNVAEYMDDTSQFIFCKLHIDTGTDEDHCESWGCPLVANPDRRATCNSSLINFLYEPSAVSYLHLLAVIINKARRYVSEGPMIVAKNHFDAVSVLVFTQQETPPQSAVASALVEALEIVASVEGTSRRDLISIAQYMADPRKFPLCRQYVDSTTPPYSFKGCKDRNCPLALNKAAKGAPCAKVLHPFIEDPSKSRYILVFATLLFLAKPYLLTPLVNAYLTQLDTLIGNHGGGDRLLIAVGSGYKAVTVEEPDSHELMLLSPKIMVIKEGKVEGKNKNCVYTHYVSNSTTTSGNTW